MDQKFLIPEIEVVHFSSSDIIATSSDLNQEGDAYFEDPWTTN